ncbi:MAG TPA: hypothetical protein VGM26_17315 [Rhizomicrobium sp.]
MRTRWWLLALGIALAAVAPAQARSRDDVMAGAYRCGAIGDDTTWLDCFYGAAQPVRAALGMAPAPQAQVRLATSPPAGGEPRNATVRDQAMAGAARCYSVGDDRQWLNCYYAAAQPVRTLLGLPTAGATPVPVPAEAPAFAVRKAAPTTGFSDWLSGSSDQHLVSQLTSYSFDRYNIFTVKLANGQVWRQESGDTVYAHWKKPADQYAATLTRGALGSVNLQIKGEPHQFKVSRVQ